jgi:glycosyltransferase involved in cell wall biosynthesis
VRKKVFCTLFPTAENIHLVKDVGQIPYIMAKRFGYSAFLAAYGQEKEYVYLSNEVKGLRYYHVRKGIVIKGIDTGVLAFLLARSKNIDVLNLYHATIATKIYSIVYKLMNRNGFLYLKLDADIEHEKKIKFNIRKHVLLGKLARKLFNSWFAASVSIASAETDEAKNLVAKNTPDLEKKLITVPNGVDTESLLQQYPLRSFEKKENLMITVGRLGTYQKNTEMLLQSIAEVDLQGWTICLIGPIEPAFEPVIEKFYQLNPHLKDSVKFIGNLSDRKVLASWYSRAKVFLLTSRYEGCPLVFPEALAYGNYLVTTDVSSARAVTENGEFGEIVTVGDVAGLSRAISAVLTSDRYNKNLYQQLIEHAQSKYSWTSILMQLSTLIQSGDRSC